MLRMGIWGCGGISAMHRSAYKKLEDCGAGVKLVALRDINKENFDREIKINLSKNSCPLEKIDRCYTDIDEMLEKEKLDMVDVCLPSQLHKEAAIKLLRQNINVLLEKPMALSAQDCREIIAAEEQSDARLMIAQCERFTAGSDYLKAAAEGGRYGRLISAEFSRISQTPVWRFKNRAGNTSKTDGVIFDMHIHDVDLVQYNFGEPERILAVSEKNTTYCDSVTTIFKYKSGYVNIIGDWGMPQSTPFAAKWRVCFGKAAIARDENGRVTLYRDDGATVIFDREDKDCFFEEIKYFVGLLEKNAANEKNPPQSTLRTIELIEKIEALAEGNI